MLLFICDYAVVYAPIMPFLLNPDISGDPQQDKPLAGLIRTLVNCMNRNDPCVSSMS